MDKCGRKTWPLPLRLDCNQRCRLHGPLLLLLLEILNNSKWHGRREHTLPRVDTSQIAGCAQIARRSWQRLSQPRSFLHGKRRNSSTNLYIAYAATYPMAKWSHAITLTALTSGTTSDALALVPILEVNGFALYVEPKIRSNATVFSHEIFLIR